jgi:hypothetical protein
LRREYIANPDASLTSRPRRRVPPAGKYAATSARLLPAGPERAITGCLSLRSVDAGRCEMNSHNVCHPAPGFGPPSALCEALAPSVYGGLGFTPVDLVSYNPVPGTPIPRQELC